MTALRTALAQTANGAPAVPARRPDVVTELEPTEELMHQHGLLRRATRLLDLGAQRLAAGKPFPQALGGAASLFRRYGVEHHERKLEEGYVFPDLRGADARLVRLTDVLVEQHRRTAEIVDAVIAATRATLSDDDIAPLADSLRGLRAMHDYHTAVEETIVFPTWRSAVDARRYRQVRAAFTSAGQRSFGRDGIEGGVKQMEALENALGAGDLAATTPPAPPR